MAQTTIKKVLDSDNLFLIKNYSKTGISIAANSGYVSLSANDLGIVTPDGYKPVAVTSYYNSPVTTKLTCVSAIAEGTDRTALIVNQASTAQSGAAVYVSILYVKSEFVSS